MCTAGLGIFFYFTKFCFTVNLVFMNIVNHVERKIILNIVGMISIPMEKNYSKHFLFYFKPFETLLWNFHNTKNNFKRRF